MRSGGLVGIGGRGGNSSKKMAFEGWPFQNNRGKMTTGQALTAVKRMNVTMMSMTVMPFTLVTRRPYCPGRPKELCFTTLSLAMETMGMRLSVVKQSFFGPPGHLVTKANWLWGRRRLYWCYSCIHQFRWGRCQWQAKCHTLRASHKLGDRKLTSLSFDLSFLINSSLQCSECK